MDEATTIRSFSKRLIEAQRPVRILESVRWTDDIADEFFRSGADSLPEVDYTWYQNRPLGFDREETLGAFENLKKDVSRKLGRSHPASEILQRMCDEYMDSVRMLGYRGKQDFGELSKKLFGSTKEPLHPGEPTLAEFGHKIKAALDRIEPCMNTHDPDDEDNISGTDAAAILGKNLSSSMGCHGEHPTVIADDGITADAAAGAKVIKLRLDAKFSMRELRLLEVHEGWVHVGTTLNGHAQTACSFLSKGTPSATITQEGLAVLTEIVAFASSPARQRRINNRILAVGMAEDGADFLDVYRFFTGQGFSKDESFQFAARVFRGSTPKGLPFTKDIAYTKGFVLLYNFLRAAVNSGQLDLIPLIFCGKTVLEDIGKLRELLDRKLLEPPAFVPQPYADLHGLAAWMCYDGVLAEFGSEPLQQNFQKAFQA